MIVLDLPLPPSVNRTRRIDWRSRPKVDAWTKLADRHVLVSRSLIRQPRRITGRVQVEVTLDELALVDADNILKHAIDFLRRIEAIEGDSKKHLRRIVVQWGTAPEGCRVVVKGEDHA